MRRKYFGLAIAAIATLGPMQAWGGDREIAQQIIQRLKTNRDSGALKDFTLDMKVDQGVVLFRGSVSQATQKALVLQAAHGVDGIARVVDELSVNAAPPAVKPEPEPVAKPAVKPRPAVATVVKPKASVATAPTANLIAPQPVHKPAAPATQPDFSLRQALAAQAQAIRPQAPQIMPGEVRTTAAIEPAVGRSAPVTDEELVAAVVSALGQAQKVGQLKGFGVDVKSQNGVLQLTGRAALAMQRDTIIRIAESIPGVAGVREAIAIPTAAPSLPRLPEPPVLQEVETRARVASSRTPGLAPVAVDHVDRPARPLAQAPAAVAAAPVGVPAMTAPYRSNGMPMQAAPASAGMPMMGQPVPMAPYTAGGAAPRYDSPNLPNYAWPGYAAHPNYAALTYPQQYSPSAWPYIGPFYPYPQVPMGWRRVSLEWDDGWWFLDFTDR